MTSNRRRRNRRGLAIVPALVCLLLVTMVGAAMLKLAHVQRGAARDEERRMQAEWLAESGAARASARLLADAAYLGETWELPASAFGSHESGRVKIAVEPLKDSARGRRVEVVADYPRGDEHRARHSKHIIIHDVDPKPETSGGPK